MIVSQLSPRVPHIPQEDLMAVALMVTRSTGAILRLAMTSSEEMSERMIMEVKFMIKQYLSTRLGQIPVSPSEDTAPDTGDKWP